MKYLQKEEYLKLPWIKQINMLTFLYMSKAEIPFYVNKKMNNSFFKLRKFFQGCEEYKSIYVFLLMTERNDFNNLTEMFKECNMYYERRKYSKPIGEETVAESYKPISLEDVLKL